MPKLIARWNPARDVWETETTGLFCEHSDVFSETFPTSGMWAAGMAYVLPTSAPLTDGSASSSLLPTPVADHSRGLPQPGTDYASLPNAVIGLLPTPTSHDSKATAPSQLHRNSPMLSEVASLLPTPTTTQRGTDANMGSRPEAGPNLHNAVALLPTPAASVANDGEGTATWLARRELVKQTAANGNGMGMPLTIAALLIVESSGDSTSPRSGDGKPSSVA